VHSDNVDTISGKLLYKFVRLLVSRETSGHTALSTDETDLIAFAIYEMISFGRNKALLTCRTVVYTSPGADIRDIIRRIMCWLEREHRRELAGSLNLLEHIRVLGTKRMPADQYNKEHKKRQFSHDMKRLKVISKGKCKK
jgi:hypothetical protein